MDVALHRLVERSALLAGAEGAAVLSLPEPQGPQRRFVPTAVGCLSWMRGELSAAPSPMLERCIASRTRGRGTAVDLIGFGGQAPPSSIAEVWCEPIVGLHGALVGVLLLASSTAGGMAEGPQGPVEVMAGALADVLDRQTANERERERAAALVAKSEANLRTLVEGLAEGMLIQRDGRILYANRAFARMLGESEPADLVGRSIEELCAVEERAVLAADIASVVPGRPTIRERRVRRVDGSFFLGEVHASAIDYEGRAAIAVLLRDVGQRREDEQRLMLTERLASVGTMTAAVAHEINNPLTVVWSGMGMVLEGLRELGRSAPSPRLAELEAVTEEARAGADRIRRIVHSMRMLARDASHDEPTVVDPRPSMVAALQLVDNEVHLRARLVRDLGPTPTVRANETRLTQVFVNLLANAAHAIPLGNPEQHAVRITSRTSAEGEAVLEVSDTGSGIPHEVRSRIFDPFFTTKPVGQGTGLGLAIVHRIVTGLDGRLEVESEPGRGSTFRVVLPGALPSRPAQGEAEAVSPAARTGSDRPRVLVVDDDVNVARAVSRLLARRFEMALAHSGEAALAVLAEGTVDAVVCDLMMPGMDGATLFAEIERLHPALVRRVVFLTGGTFAPHLSGFLEHIPNQRLEKPVDREVLEAAIDAVLR